MWTVTSIVLEGTVFKTESREIDLRDVERDRLIVQNDLWTVCADEPGHFSAMLSVRNIFFSVLIYHKTEE